MRKVVLHALMSVDGVVESPAGGRRLFERTAGRRRLELLESESTPSGALLLRYATGTLLPDTE